MTQSYYLIETQRGPEADEPQDAEFATEGGARRAYLARVEQYLAETGYGRVATVRLLGPLSCTATLTDGEGVVVTTSLWVEQLPDTDCVAYDEHPDGDLYRRD